MKKNVKATQNNKTKQKNASGSDEKKKKMRNFIIFFREIAKIDCSVRKILIFFGKSKAQMLKKRQNWKRQCTQSNQKNDTKKEMEMD